MSEVKMSYWEVRKVPFRRNLYYLYGEVEGHPKFADMQAVSTSNIQAIDLENRRVTTLNNIYILSEKDVIKGEEEKLVKLKEALDGETERT